MLWLGAMAILFMAVLHLDYFRDGDVIDVVTTVNGYIPGGHILGRMGNLTVLILAPALLDGVRGALRLRAA